MIEVGNYVALNMYNGRPSRGIYKVISLYNPIWDKAEEYIQGLTVVDPIHNKVIICGIKPAYCCKFSRNELLENKFITENELSILDINFEMMKHEFEK